MKTFTNGKRRFLSFLEFYVINFKNQGVNIYFDHSSTLILIITLLPKRKVLKRRQEYYREVAN